MPNAGCRCYRRAAAEGASIAALLLFRCRARVYAKNVAAREKVGDAQHDLF